MNVMSAFQDFKVPKQIVLECSPSVKKWKMNINVKHALKDIN